MAGSRENAQYFLMADYWKSQDRKYCDFCKCWIADNKPSVEFHEKGRRHQENVKKKLRTITKDSAKSQRESDRVDATIRQMEAAAMQAYRKDVANNADLTSISINKKVESENLSISTSSSKKVWQEAKSKDGKLYYWNIVTNETKWTPPTEPYLSLKEQEKEADIATLQQLKAVDKHRRTEALIMLQEQRKDEAEERARIAREKLKERRVVDDIPEPVYGPIIEPGKTNPYGKWQTVKESAPLDLQLPEQQQYVEIPINFEPEPPIREFKEKTIECLEDVGQSSFKKRRIVSGAKRNTRQRLDDD